MLTLNMPRLHRVILVYIRTNIIAFSNSKRDAMTFRVNAGCDYNIDTRIVWRFVLKWQQNSGIRHY